VPEKTIARKGPRRKIAPEVSGKDATTQFDYSSLAPEFSGLSKPAQRALINNGIRNCAGLARKTLREVRGFHGLGPASIPTLQKLLRRNGLAFKA
jgi:hypothetical protein